MIAESALSEVTLGPWSSNRFSSMEGIASGSHELMGF